MPTPTPKTAKPHEHSPKGAGTNKNGVRTATCGGCNKKITSVLTDKSKKKSGPNWTEWKSGK